MTLTAAPIPAVAREAAAATSPHWTKVLETTLSTCFVPGTNLKGQASGASWLFALPSLELRDVVCIGSARTATLRGLVRIAGRLTVLVRSERAARTMRRRTDGWPRSHADDASTMRVLVWDGARLPVADGCADLVLIADPAPRSLLREPTGSNEVRRVLARTGLVYIEDGARAQAASAAGLGRDFERHLLLVTPGVGEAQTAVPAADTTTLAYFARHGLERAPFRRARIARAYQRVRRWPLLTRTSSRRSVLAGRAPAGLSAGPPQYLQRIAAAHGVDVEGWRWGISAPGVYDSRKVVFMLFPPQQSALRYVVKLTRHAGLNPRLDNERRALELLAHADAVAPGSVPRVAFAGRHRELAVLGESAIEGEPFLRATAGTPDCPLGRTVSTWLLELGRRTAGERDGDCEDVARALHDLVKRFLAIYSVESHYARFLHDQVARVAASRRPLPIVFQHGDPGAWNVVATGVGDIALLDWEAAEPRGIPLWDLLYFLRSFTMTGITAHGRRARFDALLRALLAESAWNRMVAAECGRYARTLGIEHELLEPLYHMCWMHRALKEATRLAPSRRSRGYYLDLLLAGIDRRCTPAMQRLFVPADTEAR